MLELSGMVRKICVIYTESFFLYSLCFPIASGMISPPHHHPSSPAPHLSCSMLECSLHSEQNQERNHHCKQSGGLSERKSQNSVRKQLTPKRRVSRDTSDQGSENRANTSSSTNESCCSSSGSDEFTSAEYARSDANGLADDASRLTTSDVGGCVADYGPAHEEAGVAGGGLESSD
jgi:hypothetical protein